MAAKTIPIKGEMVPPIVDGGLFHIAKVTVGSNGSTGNDVLVPTEAATTALFNVKAGTIVHEVLAKVVTAYTGSAAITLGDSDDAAGWMRAANLACTVISSELKTSRNVLLTTALTADLNAYGAGKIYSADQDINVVSGASNLVGQMDVYLVYSRVG
jgi:Ca2+-binding RTX toxin-like protein